MHLPRNSLSFSATAAKSNKRSAGDDTPRARTLSGDHVGEGNKRRKAWNSASKIVVELEKRTRRALSEVPAAMLERGYLLSPAGGKKRAAPESNSTVNTQEIKKEPFSPSPRWSLGNQSVNSGNLHGPDSEPLRELEVKAAKALAADFLDGARYFDSDRKRGETKRQWKQRVWNELLEGELSQYYFLMSLDVAGCC